MISRDCCVLYNKKSGEKYTKIRVSIFSNGNITTVWHKNNPEVVRKYNKKTSGQFKNILHDLKINGCAICGYNKCDSALNFHHVNPKDKKFTIAAMSPSRKNSLIGAELNKCILLCSNCHQEIHAKERGEKRNEK